MCIYSGLSRSTTDCFPVTKRIILILCIFDFTLSSFSNISSSKSINNVPLILSLLKFSLYCPRPSESRTVNNYKERDGKRRKLKCVFCTSHALATVNKLCTLNMLILIKVHKINIKYMAWSMKLFTKYGYYNDYTQ